MNKNRLSSIITIKKGDLFLCIGLMLSSLLFMWMIKHGQTRGDTAEIYLDNQLLYTVSLNETRHIILDGSVGQVEVNIDKGDIWIHEVTCPDQICKKMGRINRSGQVIVCVPNKIVILVKGKHPYQMDALSE